MLCVACVSPPMCSIASIESIPDLDVRLKSIGHPVQCRQEEAREGRVQRDRTQGSTCCCSRRMCADLCGRSLSYSRLPSAGSLSPPPCPAWYACIHVHMHTATNLVGGPPAGTQAAARTELAVWRHAEPPGPGAAEGRTVPRHTRRHSDRGMTPSISSHLPRHTPHNPLTSPLTPISWRRRSAST